MIKIKIWDVTWHKYAGLYNISIDAERGIADISGQVDPNMLLYALAKAGQHAELLRIKLQHPSLSYSSNPYYYGDHGLGMADMYGMASPYGSHYHQPYPIHDPYWYSRKIQDPYHYSHHANYHRRYPYRSTSSFGFAPIRYAAYYSLIFTVSFINFVLPLVKYLVLCKTIYMCYAIWLSKCAFINLYAEMDAAIAYIKKQWLQSGARRSWISNKVSRSACTQLYISNLDYLNWCLRIEILVWLMIQY